MIRRVPSRGFTVVELLVVIAVTAVLLTLAVPLILKARNSARQAVCLSNNRQVLVAINAFSAENQSRLPEARTLTEPGEYVTWRRRFFETGAIPMVDVWQCPLHKNPQGEAGYTNDGLRCTGDIASSYALNGHVLWRIKGTDREAILADTAIRRPSHTVLLPETNYFSAHLTASPPMVANYYGAQPGPYSYWHSGGGVYGFQDGHVEVINFLDTGSPDCRWHNGQDLTDDPFVPQPRSEYRAHDHPDWEYLVPKIYLTGG